MKYPSLNCDLVFDSKYKYCIMRAREILLEYNVVNGDQFKSLVAARFRQIPKPIALQIANIVFRHAVNSLEWAKPLQSLPPNAQPWAQAAFDKGELYELDISPHIGELDHLQHWIADVLGDAQSQPNQSDPDFTFKQQQYLDATQTIARLNRTSYPELLVKSQEYYRRGSSRAAKTAEGTQLILQAGGYGWYELLTQPAFAREGKVLQNCIGSIWTKAYSDRNNTKIYVLKSPDMASHVAARVSGSNLDEIKGKNNRPPVARYIPATNALIKGLNLKLSTEAVRDLTSSGYKQDPSTGELVNALNYYEGKGKIHDLGDGYSIRILEVEKNDLPFFQMSSFGAAYNPVGLIFKGHEQVSGLLTAYNAVRRTVVRRTVVRRTDIGRTDIGIHAKESAKQVPAECLIRAISIMNRSMGQSFAPSNALQSILMDKGFYYDFDTQEFLSSAQAMEFQPLIKAGRFSWGVVVWRSGIDSWAQAWWYRRHGIANVSSSSEILALTPHDPESIPLVVINSKILEGNSAAKDFAQSLNQSQLNEVFLPLMKLHKIQSYPAAGLILADNSVEAALLSHPPQLFAQAKDVKWYQVPQKSVEAGIVRPYTDNTSSSPEVYYTKLGQGTLQVGYDSSTRNVEINGPGPNVWEDSFSMLPPLNVLFDKLRPVQVSTPPWNGLYIFDDDGTLIPWQNKLQTTTISKVDDRTVYKMDPKWIKKSLLCLLSAGITKTFQTKKPTDTYLIQGDHGRYILAAFKDNNLIGIDGGMRRSHLEDLGKKLAEKLGGSVKIKKLIKPDSNLHKMLRYVSNNPGSPRSGWWVKGLKNDPRGLAGFSDALDGKASRQGFITHRDPGANEKTYQLRITPLGAKVLSMLDQGEPVDLSNLPK